MPGMTDADHAQATMMLNVINGLRGFCVQPYDEMNKKRGLQWEVSREISATAGTKYYSILKAGSVHPVDLKSRVLSATGDGIIARVYRITSSDYTGGAADPVYNMRIYWHSPWRSSSYRIHANNTSCKPYQERRRLGTSC